MRDGDPPEAHTVLKNPAGIKRLVLFGAKFTAASVAAFTSLQEVARNSPQTTQSSPT